MADGTAHYAEKVGDTQQLYSHYHNIDLRNSKNKWNTSLSKYVSPFILEKDHS